MRLHPQLSRTDQFPRDRPPNSLHAAIVVHVQSELRPPHHPPSGLGNDRRNDNGGSHDERLVREIDGRHANTVSRPWDIA